MKRLFFQGIVFLSLVAFAMPALSYTIAGPIDVGGLDTLLASKNLANSGDAAERAWAQSVVGGPVTWGTKYNTIGTEWKLTDTAGIYAHTLATSPEYFLIKTGKVADPGISHIDEFNPVPIPSAVLLFASGLGGLVGIGRWRRKK